MRKNRKAIHADRVPASEEILRTRSSDGSTEVSLCQCDSKHYLSSDYRDKYLASHLWLINNLHTWLLKKME